MIAQASGPLWALWFALVAVFIFIRGLFAGMETGIYVLNKVRLDLRAESGSRSAVILRGMILRVNNLLAVLLSGTDTFSYCATFVVSLMFVELGTGERAEWYTLAVTAPLLFILGESVPKTLFQRSAEVLVYRLAYVLRAASLFFNLVGLSPLIRGFARLLMRLMPAQARRRTPPLGHEGLAAVVAESTASGVLTHVQSVMADRVMRLSTVRLADVMIPMARVTIARAQAGREELLRILQGSNFSRLPVVDAQGGVVGILDAYDILLSEPGESPTAKAAPPLVLRSAMPVTDALYRMQAARSAMAVVRDSAGKYVGIATVKDLVEEIVGELEAW